MLGSNAVADCYLIEPAAAWIARWTVETADVRLEIDDRRSLDKVNTGEPYGRAGHVENLDEAEPDAVDPPWPPGGEYALGANVIFGAGRELRRWRAAPKPRTSTDRIMALRAA